MLGSDEDFSDTATLARQLAAMSGQLEQLDRNLRIVNETVALHARFHLAVTPILPATAQGAACALGAERFEEFAAQVERRVDRGVPLIQETIDRISAARAGAPKNDLVEASAFTETTTRRGNNDEMKMRQRSSRDDPRRPRTYDRATVATRPGRERVVAAFAYSCPSSPVTTSPICSGPSMRSWHHLLRLSWD